MRNTKPEHGVSRFSVSMAGELLRQLDGLVRARGFTNRSQALADMVRDRLVDHHGELGKREMAGTVTLVYDHHRPGLQALLTDIQHDHQALIISTMHVHLDHHHCLEVLVLRGRGDELRKLSERILSTRGVTHGKLTITTAGRDLGQ